MKKARRNATAFEYSGCGAAVQNGAFRRNTGKTNVLPAGKRQPTRRFFQHSDFSANVAYGIMESMVEYQESFETGGDSHENGRNICRGDRKCGV